MALAALLVAACDPSTPALDAADARILLDMPDDAPPQPFESPVRARAVRPRTTGAAARTRAATA